MMEHYVTLFNSLFLPQGLALHASMERHVSNYILWILCVDDNCFASLEKLGLPNVRLLQLSTLETTELLKVKKERSTGEYCWTLTPFAPGFVFMTDKNIARVTYIDADLWFLRNPKPIFEELETSGKQVLITEHAYAAEYDQTEKSGQFCVQFITFTRNGGEKVRKCWEKQCLEWCFARYENGKFGDQKYLDDWPEKFSGLVHVLQDKGLALAPWNAIRFPYSNAVFYHFHGVRIHSKNKLLIGHYSIPVVLKRNVYDRYADDLRLAFEDLKTIDFKWKKQTDVWSLPKQIFRTFRYFYRQFQSFNFLGYLKW